jgi:hypothetical protein
VTTACQQSFATLQVLLRVSIAHYLFDLSLGGDAELLEEFENVGVKSFLVHDRFPSKLRELHRQRAPSVICRLFPSNVARNQNGRSLELGHVDQCSAAMVTDRARKSRKTTRHAPDADTLSERLRCPEASSPKNSVKRSG